VLPATDSNPASRPRGANDHPSLRPARSGNVGGAQPGPDKPVIFSTVHIGLTALTTGLFALAAAVWPLPRGQWRHMLAVGVLTAVAGHRTRTALCPWCGWYPERCGLF
jgi:hypothetical protein